MNSAPTAKRLDGKTALITGAASGIGRACALLLAEQGAAVLCTDRKAEAVETVAAMIRGGGGSAAACYLDVTSEDHWRQAGERMMADYDRWDILVHSAGVSFAAPLPETTLEDWRRVMAVNLDGTFLGIRAAVRVMRAAGNGGSIVNIASASGLKAAAGAGAYCTSKAAVCMLSRVAAKECLERGDGIRVNTVCPAGVQTPLWDGMDFFQEMARERGSREAAFAAMAKGALHGRFAEAGEIAWAVLYLVSDEALYVTGTDLVIDGGYTI